VYVLCQNLHKVTKGILSYDLSCIYPFPAYMICSKKVNMFLSYTSGNSHIMPRCTFTELIMIFGLLEVFIPDL
jgi:hypothetical protein